MKALHIMLFFGAAINATYAYWSNDYREHSQCLAY
ncbi:hypothetical protein MTO96_020576, partial [Rhipicephalus appendiculatus]